MTVSRSEFSQNPTLIEVLEHPETRPIVEEIEGIDQDLRRNGEDPKLRGLLVMQVERLRDLTGFHYETNH